MATTDLTLPTELVLAAKLNEDNISQETAKIVALQLFRDRTVSIGRAAELCATPLAAFMDYAAAHGVPPQRFAVEMVESAFIGGHATEVAAKLSKLRQLGIGIDLDDFGTGYASLTHLRLFQVDRIKLDASFVEGIGDDPDDDIIVTAIVRLAKSLGLRCVAEGVETQRQFDFLAKLGCDDVQGYLFARPMDERRMTTWLRVYASRHGAAMDAAFGRADAS